jgi:hypothetical protein
VVGCYDVLHGGIIIDVRKEGTFEQFANTAEEEAVSMRGAIDVWLIKNWA